jgi:hypothetical protein
MLIKLSADLDKMKSLDTNGWAAKKKEKHQEDLEKLTSRVEKLAAKEAKKQQQMQRSISSARSEESTAKTQRAPPMSEEGMKRLIYARMMMDPEFEKAINSSNSKWEMVANKFNKGFIAGKAKLYGVDQDVVFEPLPESEHAEPVTLQKKWDKMSADYRQILMKKQGVDAEVSLRTHSHGAKRPEGEIMSEVLEEICDAEKKFKFCQDMQICKCHMHHHFNPPPRLNVRNPVATVSNSLAGTVVAPTNITQGASPASSAPSAPGSASSAPDSTPIVQGITPSTDTEATASPGSQRVTGRLGGGKSFSHMQSPLARRQLGMEGNKAS